jgi:hypothetical protein
VLSGRDRAVKDTVTFRYHNKPFHYIPRTLYLHPILGEDDTGANLGWPRPVTAHRTIATTERPG